MASVRKLSFLILLYMGEGERELRRPERGRALQPDYSEMEGASEGHTLAGAATHMSS